MVYSAILGLPTEKLSGAFSGFSVGGVFHGLVILAMFLFVALITGFVGWFFIQLKRYKSKIILLEDIAGKGLQLAGTDRAMIIKIGDSGEEVMQFRKGKVLRTAYGRKIGHNQYLFIKGEDGYWYNAVWGNFNKSLSELGLFPIDSAVRMTYTGIRKANERNFGNKNWLKENFGMILGFAVIIFILVFMWLIADKFFSITNGAENAVKASAAAIEKVDHLLSTMNSICPSGSGIKPA